MHNFWGFLRGFRNDTSLSLLHALKMVDISCDEFVNAYRVGSRHFET